MLVTKFLIIVCLVLILASFINYLLRNKNPNVIEPQVIEPLKQGFKPNITDLYIENDDESSTHTPPFIKPASPPNESESYIESYYRLLCEKEPEKKAQQAQVNTVNMFVESHYELNLSLFGKGPTIEMVNEAYEKLLNEHFQSIAKGEKPSFDLSIKQRAKEYLIAHFESFKK